MKIKTNAEVEFEIDDVDAILLSQFSSFSFNANGSIIAYNPTLQKSVYLGRIIMGCYFDNGKDVDHIDGNALNNKRSNLRWSTHQQNQMNRIKQNNNTSGYKGVCFSKQRNKWLARLCKINLGFFDNKIEAATAYDDAAIAQFGEFAKLNFPLYGA